MNTNRPSLLLTVTILLTALFSNGQEDDKRYTERTIRLQAPTGELIHFNNNGYILSFSRENLLASFEKKSWPDSCRLLLSTSDTMDLVTLRQQMNKLTCYQYRPFDNWLHDNLEAGTFMIYSTATGKNLSRIQAVEDNRMRGIAVDWSYKDPLNRQEFYRRLEISWGCPAF